MMWQARAQQFRPDRGSQSRSRWRWGSGAIAVLLVSLSLVSPASLAQQSTDLPPPPAGSLSAPTLPSEKVFQAPLQTPEPFPVPQAAVNPSPPTRRYIVLVNGDSPYLVSLVQAVEPKAGLQKVSGRQMIQAGMFETEAEAQQRVVSLKQQGIQSEITSEMAQSGSNDANRYWVVIPGSRAELPGLTQQAIQLGIRSETIQSRDRPLGTHLEIGSFTDLAQAEATSRSLRAGGLDARVYYDR